MKVLVIGGGGREHAIVWKLKQSPNVQEIYCSPGNGGIGALAHLVPACAENDWNSYVDLVKSKKIDLTVVGPEVPLAHGIVDHFKKKKLRIFGPDKACAALEGSKIFSKNFMKKHGIPTANFKVLDNPTEAFNFLSNLSLTTYRLPLVIKADGLAQGKGVFICQTMEEAKNAVDAMMVKKIFGASGEKILIEEKLEGKEVSLMAFCDGKTIKMLPPARDYKRVFDQDNGPNTGGMGAISPVILPQSSLKEIERTVVEAFLRGIKNEKLDYRGVIYFGLMLTANGPFVLEFNVRFGDPETQAVLPLVETDLAEIFNAVIDQQLDKITLKFSNHVCVSVVCAAQGYPEKPLVGKEILGLDSVSPMSSHTFLFHAGTNRVNGKYLTSGGRVINIASVAASVKEARSHCYETLSKISFDGMQYRKDIAKDLELN